MVSRAVVCPALAKVKRFFTVCTSEVWYADINDNIFSNYFEQKIQQIEGDCEVSLRYSIQQPPGIYGKCYGLQS